MSLRHHPALTLHNSRRENVWYKSYIKNAVYKVHVYDDAS